jgi:CubicO group peptidase (beta-lactamase class C family)
VHAALKEIFREASISLGGTRRPGFQYSDLGFILLGKVLEGKYGLPLDVLFLEFQRELGLPPAHRLYYAPQLRPEDVQLCVVETTYCPLRQRWLRGEVHDENCAAMGGVSGHAGLFGSGRGIYEFLAALWAHPVGDLLKRAQVQGITQVPLLGPGLYGWRLGNNDSASPFGDGKSIGHQGFTGVDLWVEPQTGRLMVSLTNRIMAGRVSPWMTQFRQEICRRAWAYHGEIYA